MGVNVPSSGRISSPWRGKSRSRIISGRSSDTTYEHTENLNPGNNFFGAGRAAQNVPPLEHQHFLAGLRQIGGVDQTVVASAHHDYVVLRVRTP